MTDERRRRRPPGEGGLYERSPGRWLLKIDRGTDPVTRKRQPFFYITVRGTKKEALRELARYREQVAAQPYLNPEKITVSDYLTRWLNQHAKHRVSAKTFERYKEIVDKHLIPALGKHRLPKLAPVHIQSYYASALTTKRTRLKRGGETDELPPLSARTVHHHHRVLSAALKQAVILGWLARNPTAHVEPPRPARTEMHVLDQPQTGKLLKAAKDSPIYLPILIAVTTGMRRGEILAMRWRDFNFQSGTLSVAQTLEETGEGLAFKAPKTERSRRTIALPKLTIDELRRHLVTQKKGRLRAGSAWVDNDLVICRADGTPVSPSYVSQAFAKLAADLKLPIRFHDLRHTHISHLLAAGVHPKVASERAGHSSVSITLDVYSHLLPGMQEEAANRIDAALRTHLER